MALERLYDLKGIRFERQMYQNMDVTKMDPSSLTLQKKDPSKFQDEDEIKKMIEHMSKNLYLTEEDINRAEERKRKEKVKMQKDMLQKQVSKQAKRLNPELHEKTHYKAVAEFITSKQVFNTKNEA